MTVISVVRQAWFRPPTHFVRVDQEFVHATQGTKSATVDAFMQQQQPGVHELRSTEYSSDRLKSSVSPAADVQQLQEKQRRFWM